MAFWAQSMTADRGDPKRKFRFTVEFEGLQLGGQSGVIWHVKTVTKPSFTVTEADHTFLDKKYYYPGRVEWNPCTFTLVDPADGPEQDAVRQMNQIITNSGYTIPKTGSDLSTMSKGKANASLGKVVINQIDHNGSTIEKWELTNSFVKDMKFGELDYTGDELIELSLEIRYDWAKCTIYNKGAPDGSTGGAAETFFTNEAQ